MSSFMSNDGPDLICEFRKNKSKSKDERPLPFNINHLKNNDGNYNNSYHEDEEVGIDVYSNRNFLSHRLSNVQ